MEAACVVEVFTEDPRHEDLGPDPGPVWVRVYILNGQSGPNLLLRVPGLFNIVCNARVDRRTPHPPEISVSQHVCV